MENTTINHDLIEVTTELTVSDIKTLEHIIKLCLERDIFSSESIVHVKELHVKLLKLAASLEDQS